MRGQVGVAYVGTDSDRAIAEHVHGVQRKSGDVDEQLRGGHTEFEMIDEIRTAGQELGARVLAQRGHRARSIHGAFIAEGDHREAACRTAARMFG